MIKRMLIDAAHPEETRVVIVNSNRVEELDFESRHKRQLRGNVYLARVTRVEPSLQAAFIEYGGNRHGFLAFSEIHPDYYKIPEADKLALKQQEEEDQRQADEEEEKRKAASAKGKSRTKREDEEEEDEDDLIDEDEHDDEDEDENEDEEEEHDDDDERDENLDPDDEDATDETDAEVADEQVNVASKRRKRISRRRYKIQEVIKRGQILLVQAVKEERGSKGAAMTTYLSLAGRYCVLMPNTPRGGGISRKISNGSDRKRLKSIMSGLDVPKGMGVIVRTAGAKQTKTEIGRDYEYLSRLWSEIRNKTMESSAPALIHEEGNLVKRSLRDLYNKDIEEVLVQGKDAFDTAHDFINMLMPSHAKHIKHYDDEIPLFLRYGAEKQIENSLDSIVQLKSGGYLVIHPTEALVSVDVNSGRSTKERNVERTALRTNLEAAEELARQMRLRDLAGLIVIDFIDMDEHKNNRAVERKMKEMLTQDRARIQTSRISQFGLMEISRQRRRRSLLEGSTTSCPHCSGVGRKRTIESSALAAIRAVEEFAVRGKAKRIRLKTSSDVAHYLLNEKRDLLTQVDNIADVFTEVVGDDELIRPNFELEVIEKREDKRSDPLVQIERDFKKEREAAKRKPKKSYRKKSESDAEDAVTSEDEMTEESRKSGRRRSRRGRRGGRSRSETTKNLEAITDETTETSDSSKVEEETTKETTTKTTRRRRAPSKTKTDTSKTDTSKTDTAKSDETSSEDTKTEGTNTEDTAKKDGRRRRAPTRKKDESVKEVANATETVETEKLETEKPKSRSTTRRKAPVRKASEDAESTAKPKTTRSRKAPTKTKVEPAVEEVKTKTTSTRTRKAPVKKSAKTDKTAAKSTSSTSSKTTKTSHASKTETSNTVESKTKTTTTRTRKAPTKKTTVKKSTTKKVTAKKTPVKKTTTKKTTTKKAPVKKAPVKKTTTKSKTVKKTTAKAPTKSSTTKKTTTKKAPVKKTTTKSKTEKKAAAKAPTKSSTTKKTTTKKAAPAKTETVVTKTATTRTRKVPSKSVEKAPAKPEPSPAATPEAKKTTKKIPEKKTKRGWWSRRKKD